MDNDTENISTARKLISKRVRFEVFKRDGFKCQYCGAQAPEAVLEVDHINPVSNGGENDIMNLVTSCRACNSGKSNILLSDNAVIQKQRAMLDELAERREQLEMMLAWRDGLKQLDDDAVKKAADAWHRLTPGYKLNDSGIKQLRGLLDNVPLLQVLDAIDAVEKHLEMDEQGNITSESVNFAWSKVGAIAKTLCKPDAERRLLYIRGICRNRFAYCDERCCLNLLKHAHDVGAGLDELAEIAKTSRNWTKWRDLMLCRIKELDD